MQRRTGKHSDKWINGQRDDWTDRHSDKRTNGKRVQKERQTLGQTDILDNRQCRERQTDIRKTDKRTDGQIGR